MPGAARKRIALVADSGNYFERVILSGVRRYAAEKDTWRFCDRAGSDSKFLVGLSNWDCDGVIGFFRDPYFAQKLLSSGVAAVNLAKGCPQRSVPSALPDSERTGALAADCFLKRGFSSFAIFGFGRLRNNQQELTGYSKRLAKEGLTCSVFTQRRKPLSPTQWRQSRQNLIDWLVSLPKPLALFARSDESAVRVLTTCRSCGLRVPQDVAILGSGNDAMVCELIWPTLSSIDCDYELLGYTAAAMLHRLLNKERLECPRVLVAPQGVVERMSTRTMVITDARVARIVRYIGQHACEPITLEDVLLHTPFKRRQVEKMFQRALRRPPRTEITRVRIDNAKRLLSTTTLSVQEVARQCGYASYSSLGDAFRRELRTSPTAYRGLTRNRDVP